jgi:hypothetical protein
MTKAILARLPAPELYEDESVGYLIDMGYLEIGQEGVLIDEDVSDTGHPISLVQFDDLECWFSTGDLRFEVPFDLENVLKL